MKFGVRCSAKVVLEMKIKIEMVQINDSQRSKMRNTTCCNFFADIRQFYSSGPLNILFDDWNRRIEITISADNFPGENRSRSYLGPPYHALS